MNFPELETVYNFDVFLRASSFGDHLNDNLVPLWTGSLWDDEVHTVDREKLPWLFNSMQGYRVVLQKSHENERNELKWLFLSQRKTEMILFTTNDPKTTENDIRTQFLISSLAYRPPKPDILRKPSCINPFSRSSPVEIYFKIIYTEDWAKVKHRLTITTDLCGSMLSRLVLVWHKINMRRSWFEVLWQSTVWISRFLDF